MKEKLYKIFFKFQLMAVILIIIDQVTKIVVANTMNEFESIIVIKNFFKIYFVYNTGAAFSLFSNSTLFLTFISIACVIGLEYYLIKHKPKDKFLAAVLVVLVAGAFGNLIDRIIYGKVIDFLSFTIFGSDFATFNVADMCVTISAILLIVYYLFFNKTKKENKEVVNDSNQVIEDEVNDE